MTLAESIPSEIVNDPTSFRSLVIILNLLVLLGLTIWVFRTHFRTTRKPPNLTPNYDDDILETSRLEKVLGWALLSSAIIAVALPLYWLREPGRQSAAQEGFDERSVERGAILFAAEGGEDFDANLSLACANCHGGDGSGGNATTVIANPDPVCEPPEGGEVDFDANPECRPSQVSWSAPPLDTVFLRYPDQSPENRTGREQIKQIIVFGRPGTPMPAWGTDYGGITSTGAKNDQAIEDLLNYIESIQISPEDAQARATTQFDDLRGTATPEELAQREEAVAEARATRDALPADAPEETVAEATDAVTNAINQLKEIQSTPQQAVTDAEIAVEEAEAQLAAAETLDEVEASELALESAERQLENAQAWVDRVEIASDGELLFELNCARCHTDGWSYFNPLDPDAAPLPGPQGGGGFGPNLREGSVARQFPNPALHLEFVRTGSTYQVPYGVAGIGTGRMPGFAQMLTEEQIDAIVDYERNL
ncbi:MAG: cytochrome c [Acidimicrobiia bacterium]|nr:cytochrome c [Acidimicrobiia bacterium]